MTTYELKLDIDNKMKKTQLTNLLCKKTDVIRKIKHETIYAIFNIFETHKGYHVYVTYDTNAKLNPKDIVMLQLIYGSDPAREMHNLERIEKHIKNWNVLFSSKYKLKYRHNTFVLGKKISAEKYVESFIY